MKSQHVRTVLGRIPGVTEPEEGRFVFVPGGEVSFYFGRDGERVEVTRVREARVADDWLELEGHHERAFFPCDELVGFKAAVPEDGDEGRRAGFSS